MPTTPTSTKKRVKAIKTQTMILVIGVLSFITCVIAGFLIDCPTKIQNFIVYALIGVGVTGIYIKSAEKTSVSIDTTRFKVSIFGCVAFIAFLFIFNPIKYVPGRDCNVPVGVTVFVHGPKGPQDIILRNQGHVLMVTSNGRFEELINDKGAAHFTNLSEGDKVKLDIVFSEPYHSLQPDSEYVISYSQNIDLPINLTGNGKIHGRVQYNDEPLSDVIVQVDELTGTTDATGRYRIDIPDSMRAHDYQVWFIKGGFKNKMEIAYPQTGLPLDIIMEKKP